MICVVCGLRTSPRCQGHQPLALRTPRQSPHENLETPHYGAQVSTLTEPVQIIRAYD